MSRLLPGRSVAACPASIAIAIFAIGLLLTLPTGAAAQAVTLLPVVTSPVNSGLDFPQGVAFDGNGNLYIADYGLNAIQKVNLATSAVTTVAGGGSGTCVGETDSLGDGCPATVARLFSPAAVAVDAAGDMYIADSAENVVRVVPAATGIISIYAGGGSCGSGFCGDGGQATAAELNVPVGVTLDAAGNLLISDRSNNRIRKVTAATGIINTIAGGGTGCSGQTDIYGDGCPATSGYLSLPAQITLDAAGNLYIADVADNKVRKVSASTKVITSVAGNGTAGYTGDSGQATAAELHYPEGIAVDSAGNLYIGDSFNNAIRMVTAATGVIGTMAGGSTICVEHTDSVGDGCPALYATFNQPYGVALDAAGNLFLADYSNSRIREVSSPNAPIRFPATLVGTASATQNIYVSLNTSQTVGDIIALEGSNTDFNLGAITGCVINGSTFNPPGTICLVPVTFAPVFAGLRQVPLHVFTGAGIFQYGMEGVALAPQVTVSPGLINTVAGTGTQGYTGDNGPATQAEIYTPEGMVLDVAGNLYFSDTNNSVVRKVSTSGIITTFAGIGTAGYSGDGGPALSAQLNYPEGLALDAAGNLYIADTISNVVRKVNGATGIITTVAGNGSTGFGGDGGPATSASFNEITDVAVDQFGNLYLADYINLRVRKINAASGIVNTVAGGGSGCATQSDAVGDGCPAYDSLSTLSTAVGLDPSGNWYLNDASNALIHQVSAATGIINNVAGNFNTGYSGDNGPATSAEMNLPYGFGVDAAGDIYVADTYNNVIRQVYSATDTIITLAGNGTEGYAGDGGPATSAEFTHPWGTQMDQAGNLYIEDSYNDRVRMVSASGAPLDFPATPVGSSSTRVVVVTNVGNQPLSFTSFAASTNFGINADASSCSTGRMLPAGGFCKIGATCHPTVTGNLSGTLTISDNALNTVGALQTVALSCIGGFVTATNIVSSANPSTGGQTVTFTATVGAASGGTPTGTVTFYNGATSIGTAPLSGGVAKLQYSSLTPGTHSITAAYPGSATDAPSTSAAIAQVANLDPTTTSLGTSPNPSTPGQSVALTATVMPGNGVAATGTVSFYSSSTLLGNVALSGGVATLNHSFTGGTYSLTAKYTGSNYKSPSTSNVVTQKVGAASATAVASNLNPSTAGALVTFTATVTPAGPPTPTGTVAFSSNGTSITGCSAVTLTSSHTAACSTTALAVGIDSITAVYSGDTNYLASTSATLPQVVSQAASATALASSANPSSFGQPVTFTATVTGDAPTGTVAFTSNGATLSGCSAVALAAGSAQCSTSTLAIGTESIVAAYSGDANNAGSSSAALAQVVKIASTNTALASSLNPSTGGQSVTFTATVSASGGGTPMGTVTFYNGASSIGSVTLSGGVAKLNDASLVAGTHSITATYNGSAIDAGSTSTPVSQVVNLDPTTTSLASSPNPSTTVVSVTMTATVTPGNGVAATGTVSFYSGSTLLGNATLSGGVATLNHLFTTTGTFNLTAKYTGSNYKSASTSSVVMQTVDPD